MNSADRKEAIRICKEIKTPCGIFAVRCQASGRIWVGSSPNLHSAHNRFWFCLRQRSHPNRDLQNEWNSHGEQSFQYEVLEKLEDDIAPLASKDLLKENQLTWQTRLGAQPA